MTEAQDQGAGKLTRRRLLQAGVAGGVLLGVLGLVRGLSGDRPTGEDRAIGLSPSGFLVGRALVEALLPAEDGFPSGLELGIHQRLDEEVWASPPAVRDDVESALTLLEWAPPVVGRYSRLSHLNPAERLACFDALLRSRPRLVVAAAVSLKQMLHAFYHADPAVWAGMGYEGPFVRTPVLHASSVRYHELLELARQRPA